MMNINYLTFIDRPYLHTIAQAECVGEPGAAIGVDRRLLSGPADRDIGGGNIDGVGAEALQMRQPPIAGGTLGGMDSTHPAMADIGIAKPVEVEHLALAPSFSTRRLEPSTSTATAMATSPLSEPARWLLRVNWSRAPVRNSASISTNASASARGRPEDGLASLAA